MNNKDFWNVINDQISELSEAKNADDVIRILSHDRNPYGDKIGCGDGFFAGSGGDEKVFETLVFEAGWKVTWMENDSYYALSSPDGNSIISYVEGDIYSRDVKGKRNG